MASNAIAGKNDGAWSEVTGLANKDAAVEIVGLVRDVIEIAHIESVRSRSGVGTIVRMLPGTLCARVHDLVVHGTIHPSERIAICSPFLLVECGRPS